jgi:hypothetical protein
MQTLADMPYQYLRRDDGRWTVFRAVDGRLAALVYDEDAAERIANILNRFAPPRDLQPRRNRYCVAVANQFDVGVEK